MKDRIYRYVVRYDAGAAPNPFGGWCSLAICKPTVRRSAQAGDWIIGLRSQQTNRVIYVMQVEERLTFSQYWYDSRFKAKRPENCASSDNIYRPDSNEVLVQVPNSVHNSNDIERDLSGQRVLVGRRYWYFGNQSPDLPPYLVHLIHRTQGHSLPKNRREEDVQDLLNWLSQWPCGIHGSPLDEDLVNPDLTEQHPVQKGCGTTLVSNFNHMPLNSRRPGC